MKKPAQIRKSARGKKAGDHTRYKKVLSDGTILITKVSHGHKQIDDPDLFKHILRTQLQVTANQFWAAVDDGIKPQRPGAEPEPPPPGEAVARWQEFLTSGGSNGPGV